MNYPFAAMRALYLLGPMPVCTVSAVGRPEGK
jgi:hypothetical protein